MATKEAAALPIVDVFALIAEIVLARGDEPLTRWPDGWDYDVDEQWYIVLNGGREPLRFKSKKHPDGMAGTGVTIEPLDCYVEYNGWMAGSFNPIGGILAAGEGANEDTFIAALKAALIRERTVKR